MIDPPDDQTTDREIDQVAARLRKRFQGVKEKLHQMAVASSLVTKLEEDA